MEQSNLLGSHQAPSMKFAHGKAGVNHHFWSEEISPNLYGRHFTIYTDHQPLKHLFNESPPVPVMASSTIMAVYCFVSAQVTEMCSPIVMAQLALACSVLHSSVYSNCLQQTFHSTGLVLVSSLQPSVSPGAPWSSGVQAH